MKNILLGDSTTCRRDSLEPMVIGRLVIPIKAYDRIPREVVRWALRKLGVDEWHRRTVMALYTEASTVDSGKVKI